VWFLLWQLALGRYPTAIGSSVAAIVVLAWLAYASRERLNEVGRNWFAGRIQSNFAQRVTRYRMPGVRRRSSGPVIASARESFSQSNARRSDAKAHEVVTQDVTVLRFVHRGRVARAPAWHGVPAKQVRLVYRLDLSGLFPRLHDAVRGFASLDKRTGQVSVVDVPRNYRLPLRASVRWNGERRMHTARTLVLNKNGLVRLESEYE
jgi:hypothetical protein